MGEVLQRAGGGKVTVEGLSAGIVQNGKTVTVKQGSKVVKRVTGSCKISIPNFFTCNTSGMLVYYFLINVSGYSHVSFKCANMNNYAHCKVFYDDVLQYDFYATSTANSSFTYDRDMNEVNQLKIQFENGRGLLTNMLII